MTAQTLRAHSVKSLADMARKRGVDGWHSMRKDQLVQALLHINKPSAAQSKSPSKHGLGVRSGGAMERGISASNGAANRSSTIRTMGANGHHNPQIVKRLEQTKLRMMRAKILAVDVLDGRSGAAAKDRLVVMVRGPYWLHAYWK